MKPAASGTNATWTTVPGPESTAEALGNDGIRVVSTPYIIGLLEEASHRAVRDLFDDGEASVGTRVDIEHLAPAFPGIPLHSTGTLTATQGRRLTFSVEAVQEGRVIMRGSHQRALVRLDRFQPAASASAPAMQKESGQTDSTPIEFFFDYHSPWCYLALERLGPIAQRTGSTIVWKPMHLANLIERIDGRRPLDANPAFVKWFKQDMLDWAEMLGVPLRYHPQFPLRPSRALRASAYAASQGRAQEFVRSAMRAYWAESKDISSLEVLAEIGNSVGLDGAEVAQACGSEVFRKAVDDNTVEAVERGVFGAPTFFAGDKMFWGNDRLEMLERHLRRGKPA